MGQHYTTIDHDGEQLDVTVDYTCHPFLAGKTDGRRGPKLEPDEEAWIEVDNVYTLGADLDVSPDTIKALSQEIGDMLAERSLCYEEKEP